MSQSFITPHQVSENFTTVRSETSSLISTQIAQTNRKTIQVYCDLCGNNAQNTRENLSNQGWEIYPNECFCPNHY